MRDESMHRLEIIYQAPIPKYKTIAILTSDCKKNACEKLKEKEYKSGYIVDRLGNRTHIVV